MCGRDGVINTFLVQAVDYEVDDSGRMSGSRDGMGVPRSILGEAPHDLHRDEAK